MRWIALGLLCSSGVRCTAQQSESERRSPRLRDRRARAQQRHRVRARAVRASAVAFHQHVDCDLHARLRARGSARFALVRRCPVRVRRPRNLSARISAAHSVHRPVVRGSLTGSAPIRVTRGSRLIQLGAACAAERGVMTAIRPAERQPIQHVGDARALERAPWHELCI